MPHTLFRSCAGLALLSTALFLAMPGRAQETNPSSERALKAAFIYNFMLFSDWPVEVGPVLQVCLNGPDRFDQAFDALQDKRVEFRSIVVQRKSKGDSLRDCHLVYVSDLPTVDLVRMRDELSGKPALTVADSPGAARQGFAINLVVVNNKLTFGVNLQAARAARIRISSKLLQRATEVIQ